MITHGVSWQSINKWSRVKLHTRVISIATTVRVDLMNMIVVVGGSFLDDPLITYHS